MPFPYSHDLEGSNGSNLTAGNVGCDSMAGGSASNAKYTVGGLVPGSTTCATFTNQRYAIDNLGGSETAVYNMTAIKFPAVISSASNIYRVCTSTGVSSPLAGYRVLTTGFIELIGGVGPDGLAVSLARNITDASTWVVQHFWDRTAGMQYLWLHTVEGRFVGYIKATAGTGVPAGAYWGMIDSALINFKLDNVRGDSTRLYYAPFLDAVRIGGVGPDSIQVVVQAQGSERYRLQTFGPDQISDEVVADDWGYAKFTISGVQPNSLPIHQLQAKTGSIWIDVGTPFTSTSPQRYTTGQTHTTVVWADHQDNAASAIWPDIEQRVSSLNNTVALGNYNNTDPGTHASDWSDSYTWVKAYRDQDSRIAALKAMVAHTDHLIRPADRDTGLSHTQYNSASIDRVIEALKEAEPLPPEPLGMPATGTYYTSVDRDGWCHVYPDCYSNYRSDPTEANVPWTTGDPVPSKSPLGAAQDAWFESVVKRGDYDTPGGIVGYVWHFPMGWTGDASEFGTVRDNIAFYPEWRKWASSLMRQRRGIIISSGWNIAGKCAQDPYTGLPLVHISGANAVGDTLAWSTEFDEEYSGGAAGPGVVNKLNLYLILETKRQGRQVSITATVRDAAAAQDVLTLNNVWATSALASAPVYGLTTERLYARLPAIYHSMDTLNEFQLKQWISGVGDTASDYEDTMYRWMNTDTHDSELLDPQTADDAWIPFLAQLAGVPYQPGDTAASLRRKVIDYNSAVGSKPSLITAVQTELVNDREVEIFEHMTDSGAGDEWDVLVQTHTSDEYANLVPEDVATGKTTGDFTYHAHRMNLSPGDIDGGPWSGTGTVTSGSPPSDGLTTDISFKKLVGEKHASVTTIPGAPYTLSVWVNPRTETCTVKFGSKTYVATGTGWQRVVLTEIATNTSTVISVEQSGGASGVYVCLVMTEMSARSGLYVDDTKPGWTFNWGIAYIPVNYCTNPNFEVSVANWDATGATLAQSSDWSYFGDNSCEVTTTGGECRISNAINPAERRMIATMYVRPTTSDINVVPFYNFNQNDSDLDQVGNATLCKAGATTRVVYDFTLPVDAYVAEVGFKVKTFAGSDPLADEVLLFDSVSFVNPNFTNTYFDGDSEGALWDGTTGLSESLWTGYPPPAPTLVKDSDFYESGAYYLPIRGEGILELQFSSVITVAATTQYSYTAKVKDQTPGGSHTVVMDMTWFNGFTQSDGIVVSSNAPTRGTLTATSPSGTTGVYLGLIVVDADSDTRFVWGDIGLTAGSTNQWAPHDSDPLDAIERAGVKPAGVKLYHKSV